MVDESALNAELVRYQDLGRSFEQRGLVEVYTDFRTRGDAAAYVASHSDAQLARVLRAASYAIGAQGAEILRAFTPYATGQMAESTGYTVTNLGGSHNVAFTQDRMNTRGTAQVPPLVIGGHATRGGGGYVEPNPYNVRAQPYIEEMATAETLRQGDLLNAAVMEGWTEYATHLERVYPPGGGTL